MLIAGIPPLETLGTNKLQSLFGSGSASIAYARHGHVNLREQLPMALMSAAGAVLGALLATVVPADVLEAVLPFLLIGIALYFGFKPNIGDLDKHRRLSVFLFTITFVPLIGLYDGVFGPGTGSFFMLDRCHRAAKALARRLRIAAAPREQYSHRVGNVACHSPLKCKKAPQRNKVSLRGPDADR